MRYNGYNIEEHQEHEKVCFEIKNDMGSIIGKTYSLEDAKKFIIDIVANDMNKFLYNTEGTRPQANGQNHTTSKKRRGVF